MAAFRGESVRSADGREVVRFTTPSGVRAMVDTSISAKALDKMANGIRRRITRRERAQQRQAANHSGAPLPMP